MAAAAMSLAAVPIAQADTGDGPISTIDSELSNAQAPLSNAIATATLLQEQASNPLAVGPAAREISTLGAQQDFLHDLTVFSNSLPSDDAGLGSSAIGALNSLATADTNVVNDLIDINSAETETGFQKFSDLFFDDIKLVFDDLSVTFNEYTVANSLGDDAISVPSSTLGDFGSVTFDAAVNEIDTVSQVLYEFLAPVCDVVCGLTGLI
jgi:hypothetical protein